MGSCCSHGEPRNPAMARGPKKHLKRLNAPKHWMLDKMGGTWAPRPSTGPHKLRECLPLVLVLRNRLKFALTKKEVQMICMQRLDNSSNEASFKLARVNRVYVGAKSVPAITTHDGRTIRYPDPLAKVHDVVKVDIETGKAIDLVKFESGATAMITKGQNQGRVGTIVSREKHIGSFEIVHLKDANGKSFATRIMNVFPIGPKEDATLVSLPKGNGLRLSILEQRKAQRQY